MASLMDDLIAVMEKEAICYEKYLELANNKKEVIIKGDVLGLQQMTQKEELVAGQLFRLEKNRKEIIDDICMVTNRKAEGFTVSQLIQDLSMRPEESQNLRQTADRLVDALQKCNQMNQTNKMLIEQSLDFLDFSINALSGLTHGNGSQTYAKQGENQDTNIGKSRFDAKQ